MTTKQLWISTGLSTVLCVAVAGAVLKVHTSPPPSPSPAPTPAPPPSPAPDPVPSPTPDAPAAIAQQRARLKLSDGRTATFQFTVSAGTLCCTAAIGLDEVLCYDLVPVGDPAPPEPVPTPAPNPPVPPVPQSPAAGARARNARQPAGAVPLRSVDAHRHAAREAGDPDVARVAIVPRQALSVGKRLRRRDVPFDRRQDALLPLPAHACRRVAIDARLAADLSLDVREGGALDVATNEAGQTVIDQAWPGTVEETLALLKQFGGP